MTTSPVSVTLRVRGAAHDDVERLVLALDDVERDLLGRHGRHLGDHAVRARRAAPPRRRRDASACAENASAPAKRSDACSGWPLRVRDLAAHVAGGDARRAA